MEKSKAELEREEQEVQRRRELAALYAEAVSLLEAKKYQEALEKWNAIQTIDPRYKDGMGVRKTAKRKLDELTQSEVVGRPWSKIIGDWIRLEANIPADRKILTEKLLLLSFIVAVIIRAFLGATVISSRIWESSIVARSLSMLFLGGMYGAIVAFALNKAIYNWRLKHSLIVIVGWALSLGVPEVVAFYFARYYLTVVILFAGLSIAVAIKWARPATRPISLIIIFASWALTWKTGNLLGFYLLSNYNTDYTWAIADALTILIGLLFTFGMQVEGFLEVIRTAFFGALGFAVGNYIPGTVFVPLPPLLLETGLGVTLWGLIGGAILEAPSRNARQILFTAAICGIGLLAGYYTALAVIPASYLATFPDQYHDLRNVIWGIDLGLAFGFLIRRASAIGVLTILGAGVFTITRMLNVQIFGFESWTNIVRGALIGLVLGYAYGYMRKAKPLAKVENEIEKMRKQQGRQQGISISSKWAGALVVSLFVLGGILLLASGLPMRYSSVAYQNIILYDEPEGSYKSSFLKKPEESFYLCEYDVSSKMYLIAVTFWGCKLDHTLGWTPLIGSESKIQNSYWSNFLYRQP
jgi:hypothetical protein